MTDLQPWQVLRVGEGGTLEHLGDCTCRKGGCECWTHTPEEWPDADPLDARFDVTEDEVWEKIVKPERK